MLRRFVRTAIYDIVAASVKAAVVIVVVVVLKRYIIKNFLSMVLSSRKSFKKHSVNFFEVRYNRAPKSERSDFGTQNFSLVVKQLRFQTIISLITKFLKAQTKSFGLNQPKCLKSKLNCSVFGHMSKFQMI